MVSFDYRSFDYQSFDYRSFDYLSFEYINAITKMSTVQKKKKKLCFKVRASMTKVKTLKLKHFNLNCTYCIRIIVASCVGVVTTLLCRPLAVSVLKVLSGALAKPL